MSEAVTLVNALPHLRVGAPIRPTGRRRGPEPAL